MREEHVHGRNARTAVHAGFQGSAKVVTAAAIIMLTCSRRSSPMVTYRSRRSAWVWRSGCS
ncbi:hypothetical protein [Microbacterium saperdae]|uniref:hypothetical protein n=1 Tax=Microbacterium saperdae TaxID=69368 RepID=UPI003899023B